MIARGRALAPARLPPSPRQVDRQHLHVAGPGRRPQSRHPGVAIAVIDGQIVAVPGETGDVPADQPDAQVGVARSGQGQRRQCLHRRAVHVECRAVLPAPLVGVDHDAHRVRRAGDDREAARRGRAAVQIQPEAAAAPAQPEGDHVRAVPPGPLEHQAAAMLAVGRRAGRVEPERELDIEKGIVRRPAEIDVGSGRREMPGMAAVRRDRRAVRPTRGGPVGVRRSGLEAAGRGRGNHVLGPRPHQLAAGDARLRPGAVGRDRRPGEPEVDARLAPDAAACQPDPVARPGGRHPPRQRREGGRRGKTVGGVAAFGAVDIEIERRSRSAAAQDLERQRNGN